MEFTFPKFIDLDKDDFIIEILEPESFPPFLEFKIDETEKQLTLLQGTVPKDAE